MTELKNTKKTFYFGKVAHFSSRKINLIEVELNLRFGGNWAGNVSICGGFWNGAHTDYVECGQCLDSIAQYSSRFTPEKRALFNKLFGLWKRCHLKNWDDISEEDKAEILELTK